VHRPWDPQAMGPGLRGAHAWGPAHGAGPGTQAPRYGQKTSTKTRPAESDASDAEK
jgi:hypothetical protein